MESRFVAYFVCLLKKKCMFLLTAYKSLHLLNENVNLMRMTETE